MSGSHDHDHNGECEHHEHAHDPHENYVDLETQGAEQDTANRSLSEALRISFSVLRWIMAALALAFLFSGLFNVKEGTVAIRLRFGALRGEPGQQVLSPGGPYFALPEPLDEVIFVPTNTQQMNLNGAFWFHQEQEDLTKPLDEQRPRKGGLTPGSDSYLLTGDQNIVHARWNIDYRVRPEDAILFAKNISSSTDAKQLKRQAQHLVRNAAEQGILHLVGRCQADDFVRANLDKDEAKRSIQAILDELETGITITEILINQPTPPLAVRPAFKEVSRAQSEKAQKIEKARLVRSKILNEAAGGKYKELISLIDEYELARLRGDQATSQQLQTKLDALLESSDTGGRVSELLSEARTDRSSQVEKVRTEVDIFKSYLPQYRLSPHLLKNMLWQDALKEILSGDAEKFYIPESVLTLELGRDPKIKEAKERKAYQKERGEK